MLLLSITLGACGRRAEPMQLWYWHHTYLTTPEALKRSESLVDRAAAAGYTGLALWDSSLVFLEDPGWDTTYLAEFIAYAHAKGLVIMPAVLPYGHSDDLLKQNPNWAEGQRVARVKFRREGNALRHRPGPIFALGHDRFLVEPWHQYRVSFDGNAAGPVGAVDAEDSRLTRLSDDAPAGAAEFTFNSAGSGSVHVFGPGSFRLEEVALVHVLRREGTPGRVYDETRTYRELEDYGLNLEVPAGSRIHEAQDVLIDYYAAQTVGAEGLSVCLTDKGARERALGAARKVAAMMPAGSPMFLQHDEIRQMNSCEACRRMHLRAGELLAWSLRGLVSSLPPVPLYIWSDMFDPWHNAVPHFYYVEGDLRGSWEGLPARVTVMNWNGARRRASLAWFANRGNRQVIAGYYDAADKNGERAARKELFEANGIDGVQGLMYTTWGNDYSQLESYARGARAQWSEYVAARPW